MTQLHQFISVLNLHLKTNSLFFEFKKTKFILQLVKLLVKYNYFIGYKTCLDDSSKIIIFFKLNFERDRPLMISCELIFKPNKLLYLKYNQWSQSSSSLLILSTTHGLLTSREAFSYKLGGIALCKIT